MPSLTARVTWAAFLAVSLPAYGQPDSVKVGLITAINQDSNLLRFSSKEEALATTGSSSMSDTTRQLAATFQAHVPVNRQDLRWQARLSKTQYDRFDFLDYVGGEGRFDWGWQMGPTSSGDAGFQYLRSISSFEEQQIFEKDMRTERKAHLSWRYERHPYLPVRLTARWYQTDHSLVSRKILDRDSRTGAAEVRLRNDAEDYVGFRISVNNTGYPHRDSTSVSSLDDAYSDRSLGVTLKYALTDKSRLQGWVAYLAREYKHRTVDDVSGMTGTLNHVWYFANKLQIQTDLWRDFDPIEGALANQVVKNGVRFAPEWYITYKISFTGRLSYEARLYRNDDVKYDEKLTIYGVAFRYAPLRLLGITLGWRAEERESTLALRGYTYQSIYASLSIDM